MSGDAAELQLAAAAGDHERGRPMPIPAAADLSERLTFIDGYLFRVMAEMVRGERSEAAGFFAYYNRRMEVGYALSQYDKALVEYISRRFDRNTRPILHVGIGIGTLTASLAILGYRIGGIERDGKRFNGACWLRETVAHTWPEAGARYALINGEFPTTVIGTPWMAGDVVLVFTNCEASWSDELTASIISSFSSFEDIILDTRLFGKRRDDPGERQLLIETIEGQSVTGRPIEGIAKHAFYYHFRRPS
jgi:hypothetical protein